MSSVVISDTSCFIILSKIDELDLLHKVYENIFTTPEISAEYGESLPEWVKIISVKDKYRQQLLEMQLGIMGVSGSCLSNRRGLPLTGSVRFGSIPKGNGVPCADIYALSEPEFTEFLEFTEFAECDV
jgi:hypothetical protein